MLLKYIFSNCTVILRNSLQTSYSETVYYRCQLSSHFQPDIQNNVTSGLLRQQHDDMKSGE